MEDSLQIIHKDTLAESLKYLSEDKNMGALIKRYPIPKFSLNRNYFEALSKSIVYQQLSGKAAKVIFNRFLSLFDRKTPCPLQYVNLNSSSLKETGLSRQKISYINNLSTFFIENAHAINFAKNTNEEIKHKLIGIKGIGQWTIDMFLIFTLCRADVLPTGDLAIRKAFKEIYKLKDFPSNDFMNKEALRWQPYRSIASRYLWMFIDDIDV